MIKYVIASIMVLTAIVTVEANSLVAAMCVGAAWSLVSRKGASKEEQK